VRGKTYAKMKRKRRDGGVEDDFFGMSEDGLTGEENGITEEFLENPTQPHPVLATRRNDVYVTGESNVAQASAIPILPENESQANVISVSDSQVPEPENDSQVSVMSVKSESGLTELPGDNELLEEPGESETQEMPEYKAAVAASIVSVEAEKDYEAEEKKNLEFAISKSLESGPGVDTGLAYAPASRMILLDDGSDEDDDEKLTLGASQGNPGGEDEEDEEEEEEEEEQEEEQEGNLEKEEEEEDEDQEEAE
jgi:hypothetical protein